MEKYFNLAIAEAYKAYKKNEIPVGAIIVKNDKIIAKAHNNRQKKHNVIGHAEIICILKASKKLKDWRLDDCKMYVTLEPCEMCTSIIKESRIEKVYFLSKQEKNINYKKTIINQTTDCENIKINYEKLLKKFFDKLRNKVIN